MYAELWRWKKTRHKAWLLYVRNKRWCPLLSSWAPCPTSLSFSSSHSIKQSVFVCCCWNIKQKPSHFAVFYVIRGRWYFSLLFWEGDGQEPDGDDPVWSWLTWKRDEEIESKLLGTKHSTRLNPRAQGTLKMSHCKLLMSRVLRSLGGTVTAQPQSLD